MIFTTRQLKHRDLDLTRKVAEACALEEPTLDHQPGHPHGFHSHIYLGEVFFCHPLCVI